MVNSYHTSFQDPSAVRTPSFRQFAYLWK